MLGCGVTIDGYGSMTRMFAVEYVRMTESGRYMILSVRPRKRDDATELGKTML